MERFIQLNLRDEGAKAEAVPSYKPEPKVPTVITEKTTTLMANKFAHKAARNFARSSSGIFTK